MRTKQDGEGTFTQRRRREQFVDCAIDAIAELGFHRTSVAEVARRAQVSKGVVTYHFPARDDLILAVSGHIIGLLGEHLKSRLRGTPPERFVAGYIRTWVECYRLYSREMLALRNIWGNFTDPSGEQFFGPHSKAGELAAVSFMLARGQERGLLRPFSPEIMAQTIKSALEALLNQFAREPGLDLEAYGEELVTLFERATSAGP